MADPRVIVLLLIPTMMMSLKVQYSKPKKNHWVITCSDLSHFQIGLQLRNSGFNYCLSFFPVRVSVSLASKVYCKCMLPVKQEQTCNLF